jgi:hypothetical protein
LARGVLNRIIYRTFVAVDTLVGVGAEQVLSLWMSFLGFHLVPFGLMVDVGG